MDETEMPVPDHREHCIIVGGGVSAVCCAQELRAADHTARITLISASPLLKVITNKQKISKLTESFDIHEQEAEDALSGLNIQVVNHKVVHWNDNQQTIRLETGIALHYDKLCIATGGRPKNTWEHPLVISIRDTETVVRLSERMKDARRIVVLGNGGIATEVVYELKNVEIVWAIRHASISATFFDEGAAEFFQPMLLDGHKPKPVSGVCASGSERYTMTVDTETTVTDAIGTALGPDWASHANTTGALEKRSVHVVYNVEMTGIVGADEASTSTDQKWRSGDWPLYIKLTDGQVIGTDLVVNATGVKPNSGMWKEMCDELFLAPDEGIMVDERMMTSIPDVYACGDVCTAGWTWAKEWMQMRLWTQARQMGSYCGRAMQFPRMSLDSCFDLFTHVTSFFGFKVVFLGRFNGEGIEKPWHALMRITKDFEYIKVLVHQGRVLGAVLVGETGLEELFENLILDGIDISDLEDGLLNPEIDIGDYFD